MVEHPRRVSWRRIAPLAIAALGASVAVWVATRSDGDRREASPGAAADDAAEHATTSGPRATLPDTSPGAAGAGGEDGDRAEPTSPAVLATDPPDPDEAVYPVDLDRLRERMPDNLYWRLGAPTRDPEVLQARKDEERRWNELFGKVQSSSATEAEVHEYYAHRRELSRDYIEFARAVLEEYGERLPERDLGMYQLSIEMHSKRLADIPRQIDDALARVRARGR